MARFRYTALLEDGRIKHGLVEAASEALVVQRLEAVHQHPITIRTETDAKDWTAWFRLGRNAPREDVTQFTRELAWLLRAGLPLSRALEFLAGNQNGAFAPVIANLRTTVRSGDSFADALALHREQFGHDYVSLVRIAEASGTLAIVLERVSDARTRQGKLRGKVLSALLYPAILVFVAIASLGMIFTVVLPKLHGLFAGQDARLPFSTRALLSISDWMLAHGTAIVIAIPAIAFSLFALAQREDIRSAVRAIIFRLPIIGALPRTLTAANVCGTLAMLTGNCVSLLLSLELLRDAAPRGGTREIFESMAIALRRGEDYLTPMEASAIFPALVPKMLRVANETGTLVPALEQLASRLEQEFESKTERLLALLEPVIIVALSAVVGFIVITVMNGVISINDLAG